MYSYQIKSRRKYPWLMKLSLYCTAQTAVYDNVIPVRNGYYSSKSCLYTLIVIELTSVYIRIAVACYSLPAGTRVAKSIYTYLPQNLHADYNDTRDLHSCNTIIIKPGIKKP